MSSKLYAAVLAICCSLFTLPAAAQLDSSALRVKYGSPLNRETFRMPAGFDLIVDYAAGNQVCKLQVPALMPTNEKVQRASEMKQRMYDFLLDLVPDSMRGKELRGMSEINGVMSISWIEYEHLTISELHGSRNDTITVTFQDAYCPSPAEH